QDAQRFPNNHFMLDPELKALSFALRDLKNANRGELLVWHIGDLFDLWRSSKHDPKANADAISAAYYETIDALTLSPPTGCRASVLAGNHDFDLRDLDEWRAARFRILPGTDHGRILFIHGDAFEWIERFVPEEIRSWVVR